MPLTLPLIVLSAVAFGAGWYSRGYYEQHRFPGMHPALPGYRMSGMPQFVPHPDPRTYQPRLLTA